MTVLLSLAGVTLVVTLAAVAVARRWPRLDPVAPRVDAATHLLEHEVRARPTLRSALRSDVDPAAATGLLLTFAIGLVIALAAAVGLLLLMVHTNSGFARYDLALARWGADHATSTSTSTLRVISNLGGTMGVVVIGVVVGAIELRRLPSRAVPALLALVILGQFAIQNILKFVVDRPRPDIRRLTGFSGSSFPSGHATAAAATFAVVALVLGRRRSRPVRNVLAGLAVGMSVLVAGTRVLLGVHWFTDVLAGMAVGWAWAALCSMAFGGRLLHFGAPVEAAEQVARRTRSG